jgi:hypothetical protein
MRSSLNTYRKEEVVREVSGGLAETQREKLQKISDRVEYTRRSEFAQKLVSLNEAYFTKRRVHQTRKNSRDMHQCRGADSRFRALLLFARRQKKLLRHIRRILVL